MKLTIALAILCGLGSLATSFRMADDYDSFWSHQDDDESALMMPSYGDELDVASDPIGPVAAVALPILALKKLKLLKLKKLALIAFAKKKKLALLKKKKVVAAGVIGAGALKKKKVVVKKKAAVVAAGAAGAGSLAGLPLVGAGLKAVGLGGDNGNGDNGDNGDNGVIDEVEEIEENGGNANDAGPTDQVQEDGDEDDFGFHPRLDVFDDGYYGDDDVDYLY